MSGFRQDVVLAVRQLRSRPGFALLVTLTLGSAVGMNASLFTVFNHAVYQPWPVAGPDRVRHVLAEDGGRADVSLAEWRALAARSRAFTGLAAMADSETARLGDRRVELSFVSASFFGVMGLAPEHGRDFRPGEDEADATGRVALLAYASWKRHFAGDPSIVGRTIRLDGLPFTVVGIAPRRFHGTRIRRPVDVWLPLSARAAWHVSRSDPYAYLTSPRECCAWITGRLAPGLSDESARAEIETLSRQYRAAAGLEAVRLDVRGTSAAERWKGEGWGGRGARGYLARFSPFFLAVLLVLLLACANVGNLLVARGSARRGEIAVRLSLGAGRARIVRQLLTESLVLAGLAGVVGLSVAAVLPEAIVGTIPDGAGMTFTVDHRVLLYALALSTLSCVAFGLAPALHCTRASVAGALKDGHGPASARLSLRSVLLGIQVAVCVVLLVGAGLLTRGIRHAFGRDFGFDMEGIQVVELDAPVRRPDAARAAAFAAQLRAELAALGGPDRLALTGSLPLQRGRTAVRIVGHDQRREDRAGYVVTSAAYFEMLRLPIVAGRGFVDGDPPEAVAVVSESFARKYWPGRSPLGARLVAMSKDGPVREVVGVARDAYMTRADEIEPTVYLPLPRGQMPRVLARNDGRGLTEAVVALVGRLDPELSVTIRSVREPLARHLDLTRLAANAAGSVGLLALALATVGLFGVFAYAVQQRRRELGVRIALGAQAADVVGAVLSAAARPLAFGFAAGIAVSMAASRLLSHALYGLSPFDPFTYLAVVAILLSAGVAATYVPARRALSVDPAVALRYE